MASNCSRWRIRCESLTLSFPSGSRATTSLRDSCSAVCSSELRYTRFNILNLDCLGRVTEDRIRHSRLYRRWRVWVDQQLDERSEERRVGKECRSRRLPER